MKTINQNQNKVNYGRINHSIKILKHPHGNITVKGDTPLIVRNGRIAIDFHSIVSKIMDRWPYHIQKIDRDLTKVL